MFFRLTFPRLGIALLAAFLLPALASAQQEVQGRFRVMIPDLFPGEDTGRGFGEDVAEELRDLINQLPTHEPVERNDIRDAMRQFDIDDLNCIRSRQLATQINVELVMCANYTEGQDDWTITDIQLVSVASGETFTVDDFTVPDDDGDELAAQHIFGVFDRYAEQLHYEAICQEYFGSQQWANALQDCDRAIEGNPGSESSRYARARAVMELGDRQEGLVEMLRVLDLNPFHESALLFARMLSAEFGLEGESLETYSPHRDTNVDLWRQVGDLAFTAAGQAMEGQSEPTPYVERLYRRAIQAYTRVFSSRGEETTPADLGNVIHAYVHLREDAAAIDFAQRAVQVHPQEVSLWSRLANHFETAKNEFEVSEQMASQLNFWHGYSLFQHGKALQEPGTVDSARQSLPIFQQVLQLFELGREYAATVESINLAELLTAAQQYVDIQDAIIRRGRGE